MKEIWKPIKGYEGWYEVSNLGNIQSIDRLRYYKKTNEMKLFKGRIRKQSSDEAGYLQVCLCKSGKQKTLKVHIMVWDAFSEIPRDGDNLQVDHIDNNKKNNRFDNLQLLTKRQNISKAFRHLGRSSEYTGVIWDKQRKKWRAEISNNKKRYYLGRFINELDAKRAYDTRLKDLLTKCSTLNYQQN